MTLERFREITADLMDELPEVFFDELSGGVIVQEYAKPHPAGTGEDLFIMGEYTRSQAVGRGITLYYGSFMRMMGGCTEEQIKSRMREVLRHEFRHHLEGLSGLKDLEVEDEIFLRNYLYNRGKNK